MEAMDQEPDLLRAEFRSAILESQMRMKDYLDHRYERLEARVDFQFKIMMSLHGVQIAGIIALAVRLF